MLKTSYPNIGDSTAAYVQCPNCSKMYPMEDDKGRKKGLPEQCERCDCPMESKLAQEWMDIQAELESQPGITALGQRSRGEKSTKEERS